MPNKNLFQDMVKMKHSGKPVNSSSTPTPPPLYTPRPPAPPQPPRMQYEAEDYLHSPRKKSSKYGIWIIAGISILFFIFALSFFFARAEVVINPKIKDITLNENFSAVKDVNPNGLSFDLVIISGEDVKEVIGGEREEMALSATGSIFIYNTFSTAPQKLAIGTKLEGSNDKIYKTTEAVTIPGIDEEGTPGKVTVGITALEAGEEYNSDPLDFKITSFKGGAKYDKIYGRSQGKITGGFKGMSPTISDADKEVAFGELRTSLKEKLLTKATDQIPAGFILYKDAAFLTVDEETVEFSSGSVHVPVKVKGTLYGFLFNEKNLTEKIAKETINDYDGASIYIPNIRDLTFAISQSDIAFTDVQNITFNLSGNAKIVWKFDDTDFTKSLLGKSKSEFNQILAGYTNVESAQLSLSPFWVRSFPSKLKDIKVIVNYPK